MERERSPRPSRRRGAPGHAPAWTAAIAGLLVLACASTTQSQRYEDRRRELSASARESASLADGESLFAGVSTLDAATLVREILHRNPSLRAAREAWRAALARYPQETALDDPMLDVGVGPRTFGSSTVDGSYMIELRQPFPFPGKLGLRGERALAEAEASRRQIDVTRLDLAVRAQMLFADYYLAARALEINAAHLRLLEELHQSALAQYEGGLVSQQDPLQAETERLELIHREIELHARFRTRSQQLNALLHRAADLPLPPPPKALSPARLSHDALTTATERALETRPEIAAADAMIAARENARALAAREFLPDLELWGKYDRFWSERELRPSVGVALNLPLQLERRRGALEEADAELERAKRERDRLVDEVDATVATAAERVREQQHLEELLREQTLPTARDRVVAARAAYDTGQTTFITVIDAFRARLQAELAYETAVSMLARRQAEFFGAAGDVEALESGGRP
jgi:cobalt-zinc-cadmium efflux system outer membrane protein